MKLQLIALAAAMIAVPALAQDATAPAGPPVCGGKIQDGCVQSRTEKNAMTGEQADKRDAKTGEWTPNKEANPAASGGTATKSTHHTAKKSSTQPKTVTTTTVTTTTAAPTK